MALESVWPVAYWGLVEKSVLKNRSYRFRDRDLVCVVELFALAVAGDFILARFG